MQSVYVCPRTRQPLFESENGLHTQEGVFYAYIDDDLKIPDFVAEYDLGSGAKQSIDMYNTEVAAQIYRNFLDWLFATFEQDEEAFRQHMIQKLHLQAGHKILITGCGLGDDIKAIDAIIGANGQIFASDLAKEMVLFASKKAYNDQDLQSQIAFSACDAKVLPFPDNFFDGAFHFGGINLFDDIKTSIDEMQRVVKSGGRVVFGDEGVAPWLKNTEYGRMAIINNKLWSADAPLELLPSNAIDVHLSWVLGNCFYVIDFEVSDSEPFMNPDVLHKGTRGGSMRTRYFGHLEGVTEKTKAQLLEDAKRRGISVHDWLEQAIHSQLNQNK